MGKKMNKKEKQQLLNIKKAILISVITILIITAIASCMYGIYNYKAISKLKDVEIEDNMKNDDNMTMIITLEPVKHVMSNATWCYVTNDETEEEKDIKWVEAVNNKCVLEVADSNYTIFLRNNYNQIAKVGNEEVELNKIKNLKFNKDNYYIAIKGKEEFDLNFEKYGLINTEIKYEIVDPEILEIKDNTFIGKKEGKTDVIATIGNKSDRTTVYVMSEIVVPNIDKNKNKEYIPCNEYTAEQEQLLEAVLKDRIDTAGYQTRAGVVAAAIFLGLEFEYRIPYFFESGRLVNHSGARHVDGEGRYYHKGLYLTKEKYKELEPGATYVGPKPWGCKLKNGTSKYGYKAGKMYPNGLDCSGFISWTLYNGGFDVGDVGAGDNANRDDDLYDLGERRSVTMDLLNSDEIKPGDLIAYWGHMAMIIDVDKDNIYIAESLPMTKGVVVKKYTKTHAKKVFVNIMLMDSVYKEQGNLDAVKWHAKK